MKRVICSFALIFTCASAQAIEEIEAGFSVASENSEKGQLKADSKYPTITLFAELEFNKGFYTELEIEDQREPELEITLGKTGTLGIVEYDIGVSHEYEIEESEHSSELYGEVGIDFERINLVAGVEYASDEIYTYTEASTHIVDAVSVSYTLGMVAEDEEETYLFNTVGAEYEVTEDIVLSLEYTKTNISECDKCSSGIKAELEYTF